MAIRNDFSRDKTEPEHTRSIYGGVQLQYPVAPSLWVAPPRPKKSSSSSEGFENILYDPPIILLRKVVKGVGCINWVEYFNNTQQFRRENVHMV